MLSIEALRITCQHRTLLDIPHLDLPSAGLTVVLGHNGSGKSTLLQRLAGQQPVTHGRILLHGRPLQRYGTRELARQLAYMPQQLPDQAPLRVDELVQLGRFPWRGWIGRWQATDAEHCREALHLTGTTHLARRLVGDLSGGERQRVWLAMLLAQAAPVLLLDEPSAALDLAHQYGLMRLLRSLIAARRCSAIAVLHDLNLALRYADRILALQQGRIWFDGSPGELLRHPRLHELYGVELDIVERCGKAPLAVVA